MSHNFVPAMIGAIVGIVSAKALLSYGKEVPRQWENQNYKTRYHMLAHKLGLAKNYRDGTYTVEIMDRKRIGANIFVKVTGKACQTCGYLIDPKLASDDEPARNFNQYIWTDQSQCASRL